MRRIARMCIFTAVLAFGSGFLPTSSRAGSANGVWCYVAKGEDGRQWCGASQSNSTALRATFEVFRPRRIVGPLIMAPGREYSVFTWAKPTTSHIACIMRRPFRLVCGGCFLCH